MFKEHSVSMSKNVYICMVFIIKVGSGSSEFIMHTLGAGACRCFIPNSSGYFGLVCRWICAQKASVCLLEELLQVIGLPHSIKFF